MSAKQTLRIACLHGYCQNAQIFRRKTSALRKHVERDVSRIRPTVTTYDNGLHKADASESEVPLAEFIYIDAPFVLEDRLQAAGANGGLPKTESEKYISVYRPVQVVVPSSAAGANASANDNANANAQATSEKRLDRSRRSWWEADAGRQDYSGWEESLDVLKSTFRQHHFDGVLGFSQGAIMASLLCGLQNRPHGTDTASEFGSLRFAMFYSGGASRAKLHKPLYDGPPFRLPSLHVWGALDEIVPPRFSKAHVANFARGTRRVYEHAKGHMVPSDAEGRRRTASFLLDVWDGTLQVSEKGEDDDNDADDGMGEDDDMDEYRILRAAL